MRRHSRRILATLAFAVFLSLAASAPASARTLHYVRWGDSLWKLATWYGTTIEAIQAANGIWGTTIYAGETLVIPATGGTGVTAPRGSGASPADLDLLARLVTAEAEGEPYEGQVAVAAVVLNRVRSPLFPDTIAGVIHEPWQFEPVQNGRIYLPASPTALRAAQDALAGWDPTGGALYFFNWQTVRNPFLWSLPWKTTIGRHRFVG